MKTIGDRTDVVSGRALKTRSGLTINDFKRTKSGRWVYKSKSEAAKRRWNNDANLRSTFQNARAPAFGQ
jgi:hypothetical protein